ncbi:hypothetical protein [Fervidibacter sp.]
MSVRETQKGDGAVFLIEGSDRPVRGKHGKTTYWQRKGSQKLTILNPPDK